VSDKYDLVNEHTQQISELMKLHIQGMWQHADKFIRQLAHQAFRCIRKEADKSKSLIAKLSIQSIFHH